MRVRIGNGVSSGMFHTVRGSGISEWEVCPMISSSRPKLRGHEGSAFSSLRSLLSLAGMVTFVLLFQPTNTPLASIANSNFSFTEDMDKDALPDLFENLIGTSYLDPDTDGDGYIDGVEYIMRSDPLDPSDKPSLHPEVRIAAYKENKCINIQISFLPGDIALLDSFVFKIAYLAGGKYTPNSVPTLDLTSLIPYAVQKISYVSFQGLLIASYVVSFPEELLELVSPSSLGVGCRIADIFVSDVVDLDFIDGEPAQFLRGQDAGMGDGEGYYMSLVGDPLEGWSEDEACKTDLVLKSSSDGISTYEISDAQCEILLRQKCSPTDCANMIGSEVVSIDPGFLDSSDGSDG